MFISKKRHEKIVAVLEREFKIQGEQISAGRGKIEALAEDLRLILPEPLRPKANFYIRFLHDDVSYNFDAIHEAAKAVRNRENSTATDAYLAIVDKMNEDPTSNGGNQ